MLSHARLQQQPAPAMNDLHLLRFRNLTPSLHPTFPTGAVAFAYVCHCIWHSIGVGAGACVRAGVRVYACLAASLLVVRMLVPVACTL